MNKPLKQIPKFAREAEERAFWEKHDSADYVDWTKAKRTALPNLWVTIWNQFNVTLQQTIPKLRRKLSKISWMLQTA